MNVLRALAALVLLLMSAAPLRAADQTLVEGPLTVVVPESVGVGQPFVAEVRLVNQVEKVTAEWQGRVVEVLMSKRGREFRGEVLLAAGLEVQPGSHSLVVEAVRPARREMVLGKIEVTPTAFPEQRLNLPPSTVTPSKENLARIKREQALIAKAMNEAGDRRFWSFPFLRPVPGEVTSAFGLRRILNGQPRSPHTGIDFDAQKGDPVHVANQGKVILTGDFFFNGLSVFIDHGQGVVSMYFHLSAVSVRTGQHLERGQLVGLVGSTGRSTGPHLHFGMKVLGQSVDPMPLFTAGGPFDRRPGG
ncbi:Murein DD-endopeptidase MepM [Fundidesulfovibrio magnetotacticus]|uniref:Murein DD-endopeptidase MepM n=1 Tax=Fundidesulfovibrio magnetotacticus TaxID=2730080 RepID=A0A6V8LZA4_9BACT|nr:M23 family metallopeptidase [Fundidesulfovibrio magnetotacticus]GFK95558.1 Murein DD-endopeptidase MepM [Fundidesulfovibrio magnetotacticus]